MSQRIYQSINDSTGGCKKDAAEKLVIIASIPAILFSLCGIVMTLIVRLSDNIEQTPIVCVPCWQMVKGPIENVQTDPLISKLSILPDDIGGNRCCAYDSKQMSVVLELAMRQETVAEPLQEFDVANFSLSSVSAHKRLYPPRGESNDTGPVFVEGLVTRFQKEESIVEHARGIDVQEEGLLIQTSGRYFIYSSIHFRPDSVYPCKSLEYQTWGHSVEKITPNDPASSGCILRTEHTCCDECTGDDETSYTSGVFELNKGDIIRIQIPGHGLVLFRKFSSFVGLMMLGEGEPIA